VDLVTIKETDLEATMRDGTVLRSDVYRPEKQGPFPVLLCRTPYDKGAEKQVDIGPKLAERGYIVVMQDVRGRYASDGEFKPGFYSADHCDAEDGYDSVEWAAGLPDSTGKVGTFGNSYDGWLQWELGHTRPPHLVTMFPGGITANLLDRELCGVLRTGRVIDWTINNLSVDTARLLGDRWKAESKEEASRLWVERDRSKWLWYLPLMDIPEEAMPGMGQHWRRWLADHATDHFKFEEKHSEVEVPVLGIAGWYDQQIGIFKNFTGMIENGRTELARENQHLIIGPWTHTLLDLSRTVGDVDFGADAEKSFFDIADAWFRRWLKEEPSDAAEWEPLQIFVMGSNTWRGEHEWPLARTNFTTYYLHSEGHADMPSGIGGLNTEAPGNESPDEYDYDPKDPVMTLYTPYGQHAPIDQRALDGRRDVMVYATPPLASALEVTGPIVVKLWASSSAKDTDFVAKLIDVWPDGFAQELCHGIVRARYRDSFESPTLIEPGEIYEFTIQVNPTSNLFKAGHSIRLDITSSDFPNFNRNHNTGGDDYREAELQTAKQTVFHDTQHPSRVILPIIP
jgi:putative CocE/NonD family hydrolase